MEWVQIYDPLGSVLLSTLAAALPVVLLLFTLGVLEAKAHQAALVGLLAAVLIAIFVYGMPARSAAAAALQGIAYGLFPIGWIVLNAVFLYELTVSTGTFEIVKSSVAHLSADRRIQALLVAFSFGIFIEGAAGFGTPVAISSALMIGLGFSPLHAAGLSLIANTAPVAFGAIGTPILTLAAVTGIHPQLLSTMAGRQLAFVSILIPMWLVVTYSGWKGFKGVWPVALVSGGSFAVVQVVWSNLMGPELVGILGGVVSLVSTALFCTWWKPAEIWEPSSSSTPKGMKISHREAIRAWMPWVFLSVCVVL
ncbi:MAG TPA: L-lactate permease, partial [Acidobacteriota bacterium]|nr:L-lactate permease [Acidobacteriota bacterium]